MKEVDMSKMKEEMDKAMKEVDMAKIKQQLDEVKNIDMKQLQEEMQKLQGQLKDLQPKIQEELEKAKLDVEKAKEEIKEYKSFVDALDKDGLINKNKEYSIEHKDGELIINGKKQPADVYNKYRSFLEKHKKFSMKKSADDFDLNNDN
jgi:translation initiation factor 2 beta subunit (eIF-2beta)/eIF-5